jgi:hypothetical protein
MPKYNVEKFENSSGKEKLVYWNGTKHRHDAALISKIEKWLGTTEHGTWTVRQNSFQSNQNEPTRGVEYTGR